MSVRGKLQSIALFASVLRRIADYEAQRGRHDQTVRIHGLAQRAGTAEGRDGINALRESRMDERHW